MTWWLKEATAATISAGPFTNGSGSRLGSLNIIRGEMLLSKAGGAFGTIAGIATAYPDKNGNYFVGLDTTDTATRGHMRLDINNSGALPVWEDMMIVPTQSWDSLFGGDRFQTDVREFGDSGLDFTSTMKGAMGSVGVVGSVGHVASMANPMVLSVGSVGFVTAVGSVGHVASMSNPVVLSVGSVGFVSGGMIGTVSFVRDGIFGTLGYARALGSMAAGIVGTIPFAQQVGTAAHVAAVGDKTGYSISGTKQTLDDLTDVSVADIIAGVADGSLDLQEILRIILAACAGKSSGGGTTTITFRDSADSKDRISATVDSDGNRSAVTLDGS